MENNINLRIRAIRKELKLNQSDFAESLGYGRGVIENIELGRVEPKPLLLQQICKMHNVDLYWLETGEGDMFRPQTKDDVIAGFMASLLCDEEESFRRRFVEMLAGLDDDGWIFLEKTLDALYPDKAKEKEQE
jgi:transcriptional regulator with XRE-family HTH domain